MGKVALTGLILASVVILSSCSSNREREDAMMLEGMAPKEDAMMKQDTPQDTMMKKDDAMMQKEAMEKNDTMMKKDDAMMDNDKMMKDDSAMMKKDTPASQGQYKTYSAIEVRSALDAGKKVVLFFHAPWCPTCKAADTVFSKENPPADMVVFKVDFDTYTDLRKAYGVTYQHTFVALNTDESLKKKASGGKSYSELATLF